MTVVNRQHPPPCPAVVPRVARVRGHHSHFLSTSAQLHSSTWRHERRHSRGVVAGERCDAAALLRRLGLSGAEAWHRGMIQENLFGFHDANPWCFSLPVPSPLPQGGLAYGGHVYERVWCTVHGSTTCCELQA